MRAKTSLFRSSLLLAFCLFLAWVIYAADTGTFPPFIRALYKFPGGDWVGHFVLYGLLTWLAVRAWPRRVRLAAWRFPLAAGLVALAALLEELSQFWFPLRTPDWRDLAFGLLGIGLAAWLALRRV